MEALDQRSVIVAADDDQDDVDLLRMLFRKAGVRYRFDVFQRGEDVITALSDVLARTGAVTMPLLCFLDVKMPALTGHDVLRWIRSQRGLDAVPIVMLSSSDHPSDVAQAAKEGAQCYLAKYPQPAVLQQVIAGAERYASGAPAAECFRLPANLLLHA
jgi:CheY-like chemotaxis protein